MVSNRRIAQFYVDGVRSEEEGEERGERREERGERRLTSRRICGLTSSWIRAVIIAGVPFYY
jgi:hypothetical protein